MLGSITTTDNHHHHHEKDHPDLVVPVLRNTIPFQKDVLVTRMESSVVERSGLPTRAFDSGSSGASHTMSKHWDCRQVQVNPFVIVRYAIIIPTEMRLESIPVRNMVRIGND